MSRTDDHLSARSAVGRTCRVDREAVMSRSRNQNATLTLTFQRAVPSTAPAVSIGRS